MRSYTLLVALVSTALGQTSRPVIGVAGISHESASFNPAKTGLADFGIPPRADRGQVLKDWAKSYDTVSGMVEGSRLYNFDIHPGLVTSATPKGPVTSEAFEALTAQMIASLKEAPRLDGILLALHGAMVTERFPHGDTEMVRRVRKAFGDRIPIIVTHDFHANVTPEIVALSTALITFKECPHIDTRDRGIQAARIMADTVRGKVKPVQAIAKPPMMYNIVYHYTKRAPLLPIVDESKRLEKNPKILAASVPAGYQYADVEWMGPSAIVVTDNDKAMAEREAKRLSEMLWATRDQIVLRVPGAAQAVKQAMANGKYPVTLMDMGDNIGGGSAGDGTTLLAEFQKQKAAGWVVALADPQAVQSAIRVGIGGPFDLLVGGKIDKLHGSPVRVRGRVKSIHDGKFLETEIRHGGGRYFDMGVAAVIEAEGSTRDEQNLLLLTTRRTAPMSLHQLISVGIYPERQKVLTAKGTIAPRAAYEPVSARIIEVDTPGVTAVNPARFTYKLVRRPLFGLQ
ncbi:MAG: M81 family metallopeptidase [Bryobacteraceae bacterium]